MSQVVFWDSSCFIEYLKGTEKGKCCDGVIYRAEKDPNFRIATCSLTIAEVRALEKRVSPHQISEKDKKTIRKFLDSPKLIVVDVTRIIGESSRENYWDNVNLKPADSIQFASCQYLKKFHDVLYFHAFDSDFDSYDGIDDICVKEPNLDDFPIQQQEPDLLA